MPIKQFVKSPREVLLKYSCDSTSSKNDEVIISFSKIQLLLQLISKESGANSAKGFISCFNFCINDIGNWLILFKWMSDVAKDKKTQVMGNKSLVQQGTLKACHNHWLNV